MSVASASAAVSPISAISNEQRRSFSSLLLLGSGLLLTLGAAALAASYHNPEQERLGVRLRWRLKSPARAALKRGWAAIKAVHDGQYDRDAVIIDLAESTAILQLIRHITKNSAEFNLIIDDRREAEKILEIFESNLKAWCASAAADKVSS